MQHPEVILLKDENTRHGTSPILDIYNGRDTEIFECSKCKIVFVEKDVYLDHLTVSMAQGGTRRYVLETSCGDWVIIKDGKHESKICHKTFLHTKTIVISFTCRNFELSNAKMINDPPSRSPSTFSNIEAFTEVAQTSVGPQHGGDSSIQNEDAEQLFDSLSPLSLIMDKVVTQFVLSCLSSLILMNH